MKNKFSPIISVLFIFVAVVSLGFGSPPPVPGVNRFCTKCNKNFCTPKPVPAVPGFPGSSNPS